MEKKEPTTSNPTGVCEKLFNAFSPTFRPIRQLTFRRSNPESTTDVTNPPPTLPSANGGAKPGPVTLAPEKKPEPVAMPHEKAKATPATTNVKVTIDPSPGRAKAHDKVMPAPAPAPPPQSNTVPKPQPSAAPPLPKPQPPPPAAALARSKTNINEKVGDYISRVRAKMRTGSGVGRPPSS